MNDNISDKDKKDWQNFISSKEKILDKDFNPKIKNNLKVRSIDFTFNGLFTCGLKSLSGTLSLLEIKFCQSFLSLSEILLFN